jgi:hypothetical protein
MECVLIGKFTEEGQEWIRIRRIEDEVVRDHPIWELRGKELFKQVEALPVLEEW